MAKAHVYLLPGANVEATDTFASWVDTTNQLVYDMGTVVLTTTPFPQPNTSVGGYTVGNAHVQGFLSANTIVATNGLRGGSTSASGNLIISSNTIFNESALVQITSNTNNFTVNANNTLFTSNVVINSTKTVLVSAANTTINSGSFFVRTDSEFTGPRVDIDSPVLDVTSNTTVTAASFYADVDTIRLGTTNADQLIVNSAADFNSSVNVDGLFSVTANSTLNGEQTHIQSSNTIIGNSTTDRLNVTAYLESDLIPASTTVDLGTDALPYGNVHTTYVWSDNNIESLGEFVLKGTATKTIRTTGSNGSYQNLNLTFSNNSVSNTSVVANTSGLFGGLNQLYSLGSSSVNWKELYVQNSFVTGDEVVTGDLEVNGDITTSAVAFNLLDAAPATVNAFGAATAIDIGATSGTITINNPTVVGTQTTQNLWNTTALTVNAFGAATSLNLGATTGATTVRNDLVVTGDVVVNGGDITTSVSTLNLINTTAATVNAFGAATTLNIGEAGSTINFGKATGNTSVLVRGNTSSGTATVTSNVTAGRFLLAPSITTGNVEIGSTSAGRVRIPFTSTSSSSSTGALVVTGGVGIGQNLNVAENASVAGNLTVGGEIVFTNSNNITLSISTGNINALTVYDTLTFDTATISSTLTPTSNVVYDIGTTTLNWNAVHAKDVYAANNVSATQAAITTVNATTLNAQTVRIASGMQDAVEIAPSGLGSNSRKITITTPASPLTANATLTLAGGNTTLQAGTMAITGSGLNQFASTTSAQLAAVISDETGSGSLVFGISPVITSASLVIPTIGGAGATYSGSTSGSTVLRASAAAGATTITMPATTGTIALTSDISNGSVTVQGGTGLSGSGTFTLNQAGSATITLTNADAGSAQNIFKNFAVSGQSTVTANTNNDTLNLVGAGILAITTNAATDSVTFTATEVDTLASVTGRGASTTTAVTFANTTATTATNVGAVVVSGGIGIAGGIQVGGEAKFHGNIIATGSIVLDGDLTVNGTTTTINSADLSVDDKNIIIGAVTTPSDATANGGGITLRGTTDKTIIWDSTNSNWTSSEDWNLLSGNVFKINNVSVLSNTTLGSSVVSSSLTSVGTLTSGTWNATTIAVNKGGTGQTAYANGEILIGNSTGSTLTKATITPGQNITITNGAGTIAIAASNTNLTWTSGNTAGPVINSSTGTGAAIPLASATTSGVVSTAAQTFAGVKTFSDTITGSISGNAGSATVLKTARTINGEPFNGSLDITVTANTNAVLTNGNYLTGSDFNGGTATTWAVDATTTNTASKIVARDASGNFSAGTITAALNGNAATATQVNNTLTRGSYLIGSNFNGSAAATWAVDATSLNTASKVVARDASGNFSAGTITATFNGNGSNVTSIDAANITTGTLNNSRLALTWSTIDNAVAGMLTNAVGSIIFCEWLPYNGTNSLSVGDTVPGSDLNAAGIIFQASYYGTITSSGVRSGTWKALGHIGGNAARAATLFIRTA